MNVFFTTLFVEQAIEQSGVARIDYVIPLEYNLMKNH
jgi:hypothetical protein